MTLTNEQKKSVTEAELKSLEKQKLGMQDTINQMGKQIEDLYFKRREAAQALEKDAMELEAAKKKILTDRDELRELGRDLEKKRVEVSNARESLNKSKELFAEEKALFRDERERVKNENAKASYLIEQCNFKAKELDEKEESLKVYAESLKDQKRVVDESISALLSKESEIKGYEREVKEREESSEKALRLANEKQERLEKIIKDEGDKADQAKAEFDNLKQSELNGLKNRELVIARKERELEKLELDLKSKAEAIELKEGRSKLQVEEPKIEKKSKKKE